MTEEQLKALKEWVEAKIKEMDRASDLHESIALMEAEKELHMAFIGREYL